MLLKLTKIRSYVNAMKARGFSAEVVLAQSGLSVGQLQDAALLIEPRQREQVVLNMLRLTQNPALGLELGSRARLVDFGILAYAQMTAPKLRDAFALWKHYSQVVGTTVPIELEEKSRFDWRVIYRIEEIEGPVGRFDAEEITAMAVGLGPALLGPTWTLEEFTYSYPAPSYWRRYETNLGCRARFDQPLTSVRVKGVALDQDLPGHDPEFHAVCRRHLDLLVRRIGRERPTTDRLRSLLLSRPSSPPNLEEAAHYLGMSPRTLRRYMLSEKTSFNDQLSRFRLELATHFLSVEKRPVKNVASELGYRSIAAFRRAFKSWTGEPIGRLDRRDRR